MTGRWDIIRWVGRVKDLSADREKELVYREKIKMEIQIDGQNKGTVLVGGNRVRSLGEGLAVETVAKEENQGGHRNTWETGKDEVEDYSWTVLVFPEK